MMPHFLLSPSPLSSTTSFGDGFEYEFLQKSLIPLKLPPLTAKLFDDDIFIYI